MATGDEMEEIVAGSVFSVSVRLVLVLDEVMETV